MDTDDGPRQSGLARNFLDALAGQFRDCGWRPADVDLDEVRPKAAALRAEYYGYRLAGAHEERQGLVSVVPEQLKRTGPLSRRMMVGEIRKAEEQASSNPALRDDHRWTFPSGTDFERAFDALLHAGIAQRPVLKASTARIPSLGSNMATMAACPSGRLHGAVMRGDADALVEVIGRCRIPEERSELLNSWDMRGRTPLILAIEAEMYPLVCRLVECERELPERLRSFGDEDARGRRARDHATASDDPRISELADVVSPKVLPSENKPNGTDTSTAN